MSLVIMGGSSQKKATNYPDVGKTDVIYGDSIVVGIGAIPETNGWTYKFTGQRGTVLDNRGIGGTTLVDAGSTDSMISRIGTIPTYDADIYGILAFAYCMNDWGFSGATPGYNAANVKTSYETVIDAATAKGWPPNKILLVCPTYPLDAAITTYQNITGTAPVRSTMVAMTAAIKAVAIEKGVMVVDPYTVMENSTPSALVNADGIHPNNLGHQVEGDVVYQGIN